eukprot:897940-Karenia_brevis.AAC.1
MKDEAQTWQDNRYILKPTRASRDDGESASFSSMALAIRGGSGRSSVPNPPPPDPPKQGSSSSNK